MAQEGTFLRLETRGHTSQIQACRFGPDGSLVTASLDKTVRIWNPDGSRVRVLRYPIQSGAASMPFSMDVDAAGRVALGVEAGTAKASSPVYLFDRDSEQAGLRLPETVGRAAVAFAGAKLSTLDRSGKLTIWNSSGGEERSSKVADALDSAFLGNDGKGLTYVANAGSKMVIGSVGVDDLKPVGDPGSVPGSANCAAFGPNGTLVGGNGLLGIWSGKAFRSLPVSKSSWVFAVAWLRDEVVASVLNLGTKKTEVQIWTNAGALRASSPSAALAITALATSADGQTIAGGSVFGDILFFDSKAQEVRRLNGSGTPAGTVAWSEDGTSVTWGSEMDAKIRQNPTAASLSFGMNLKLMAKVAVPKAMVSQPKSLPPTTFKDGFVLVGGKPVYGKAGSPEPNAYRSVASDAAAISLPEGLAIFRAGSITPAVNLIGSEGYILGLAVSPDGRLLAGAGSDQTIQIWNLKDPRVVSGSKEPVAPILTLYADSLGEWVAWNPEKCFYAASQNGDNILSLQSNLSAVDVGFARVFSRRESYYKPEFLQTLFATGSLPSEAVAVASAAVTQTECPSLKVEEVKGAMLQPDGKYVASLATVEIVLRVTKEIDDVSLGVGNLTKRIRPTQVGGASDRRTVTAQLKPGRNFIRLVGRNKFGESNSITVPIDYLSGAPQTSTLRVFAVGVGAYKSSEIRSLPFSQREAESIGDFFRSQDGLLGPVKVTVVAADKTGKDDVWRAFQDFLKSVEPNDSVLVYFSAHGAPGADFKRYYMLPFDAVATDLERTAIGWDDILRDLSAVDCRNVILLQDTCHSGGVRVAQAELTVSRNIANRSTKEKNLVMFSSCQADEVSLISEPDKLSVFTLAILEAFQGKLPGTVEDGFVLLNMMEIPVQRQVKSILSRLVSLGKYEAGVRQVPILTKAKEDDIPIAKVGKN